MAGPALFALDEAARAKVGLKLRVGYNLRCLLTGRVVKPACDEEPAATEEETVAEAAFDGFVGVGEEFFLEEERVRFLVVLVAWFCS